MGKVTLQRGRSVEGLSEKLWQHDQKKIRYAILEGISDKIDVDFEYLLSVCRNASANGHILEMSHMMMTRLSQVLGEDLPAMTIADQLENHVYIADPLSVLCVRTLGTKDYGNGLVASIATIEANVDGATWCGADNEISDAMLSNPANWEIDRNRTHKSLRMTVVD